MQRKKALARYWRGWRRTNPSLTKRECAQALANVKRLIARKCQLYPGILVQIADVTVERRGDNDHVLVASLRYE